MSQLQLAVDQFALAREAVEHSGQLLLNNEAMLDPYFRILDQLELTAEYHLKETLTDVEAFKLKCKLSGTHLVDVAERLNIKKVTASEVNILNIHINLLGLTISDVKATIFSLLDRSAPAQVKRKTLTNFIDHVAREYRINPYHNFTHALSVGQVFFYMWSSSPKLQRLLNVDEMYVGCLACIAHDIGHSSPGLNQPEGTTCITRRQTSSTAV